MEVYVNDVRVDAQIENERTAGEVYDQITTWLGTTGHQVTTATLNGEPLDANQRWRETPVDGVRVFTFMVRSERQEQYDALETVAGYLQIAARAARAGTADQLQTVIDEAQYVSAALQLLIPDVARALLPAIDPIAAEIGNAAGPSDATRTATADRMNTFLAIVQERARELLSPESEMSAALSVLDSAIEPLESIMVDIQTEKAPTAVRDVAAFTVPAEKLLRVLSILISTNDVWRSLEVDETSLEAAASELSRLLSDLTEAFTNEDYVLVADLIEYELLPRFASVASSARNALKSHAASTTLR